MPLNPLEITGGLAIGEGLGGAIADTVEPRLQEFKNGQWQAHPHVPIDAATAAEIAAEDVAKYDRMAAESTLTGIEGARFAELYGVTLNAPGTGELLAMLRRKTIDGAGFNHGLRKAKLEPLWDGALAELQTVRLSPQELALGIVRSTVADPGLLVVTLDTAGSTIPKYPEWPGSAITEAEAGGIDKDRLRVMVGAVGLPMSPQQAASAAFRKIINRAAFNLSILEGDIRPEYADAIFEQARQIPTVGEAVQYELRGFTDRAGRLALTDLHGMSHPHSDVLYDVAGRAPSARQVYLGLARGAKWPSTYADVPEPFRSAIERSDIRPEFADIVYHNRFGEPSAFVVRALLRDGAITADRGATILENSGIPPDLATLVANFYAASGGTASDPHITKAENQLWTTTHRSYVAEEITDPTATAAIEAAGVTAQSAPAVLALWAHERSLVRKQLSPTQVRKALNLGVVNPATGQPWTVADAHAALLARGYDDADATVFLQE